MHLARLECHRKRTCSPLHSPAHNTRSEIPPLPQKGRAHIYTYPELHDPASTFRTKLPREERPGSIVSDVLFDFVFAFCVLEPFPRNFARDSALATCEFLSNAMGSC